MSSLTSRPLGGGQGGGGAGGVDVTPGSSLRLQSSLTSNRLLSTGVSTLLAKGEFS